MEEKKISFETAKLAKEKGFDLRQLYIYDLSRSNNSAFYLGNRDNGPAYDNTLEAPTQSLLQKWLREKYFLHVETQREDGSWIYRIYEFKHGDKSISRTWKQFLIYEEALEAGLFEALKLINNETSNLV